MKKKGAVFDSGAREGFVKITFQQRSESRQRMGCGIYLREE